MVRIKSSVFGVSLAAMCKDKQTAEAANLKSKQLPLFAISEELRDLGSP